MTDTEKPKPNKPDKPAKPDKPKVAYQHRITSNDATCLHTLAGVSIFSSASPYRFDIWPERLLDGSDDGHQQTSSVSIYRN